MAGPGISMQLIVYEGRPATDLAGVLGEIAAIGYEAIEGGVGFGDLDTPTIKGIFGDTGLKLSGVHTGYGSIPDPAWQDQAITFCHEMGCKHVICSGVAEGQGIQPYITTGEVFNAFGAKCKDAGLTFCYHNHAWEFEILDGEKGIHKLCEVTDPALVKLNVDVYWVTVGGEDPAVFIDRYADRVGYYHFKDGPYTASGAVAPGPYEFFELGKGTVDLAGALAAALRHDPTWIVYEQDRSKLEPKEASRISFEHLKCLGL